MLIQKAWFISRKKAQQGTAWGTADKKKGRIGFFGCCEARGFLRSQFASFKFTVTDAIFL